MTWLKGTSSRVGGCAVQVIENGKFNTEMKELDLITG